MIHKFHSLVYPKEIKIGYQRDNCTPMFTAELFTIAKILKEPKCFQQINQSN